MASFGAVVPNEHYAADALRAVDAIMVEVESWKVKCEARSMPVCHIGAAVAVGPVIFGAVGDETRLEYTVIGDAVNVSAKLEKHTKVEGVRALCTAETHRKALDQGYQPTFDQELLGNRLIEGLTESRHVVVIAG